MAYLANKGITGILEYPFSYFLEILKSFCELESENWHKFATWIRFAKYAKDTDFKKVVKERNKDTESAVEKLQNFAKGV